MFLSQLSCGLIIIYHLTLLGELESIKLIVQKKNQQSENHSVSSSTTMTTSTASAMATTTASSTSHDTNTSVSSMTSSTTSDNLTSRSRLEEVSLQSQSDDDEHSSGLRAEVENPMPSYKSLIHNDKRIKKLTKSEKEGLICRKLWLYVWMSKGEEGGVAKFGVSTSSLQVFWHNLTRNVARIDKIFRCILPPMTKNDAKKIETAARAHT